MFPMAGHSVQRIWTGFGVRPPYNLRIVTTGLVLPRNRATPEHRGGPGIPRCRHSGDNSCGVSNDKARIRGLWDARPIVVVAQRPVDWRPASCATQHSVCVCWHAGLTPHSLLQNLLLCVFPAVSLPASVLLLQIRRCYPSKQYRPHQVAWLNSRYNITYSFNEKMTWRILNNEIRKKVLSQINKCHNEGAYI